MRQGPPLPTNKIIELPKTVGGDAASIVKAAETLRTVKTGTVPSTFREQVIQLCQATADTLPADLPPVTPQVLDANKLPTNDQMQVSEIINNMLTRMCPHCATANELPYDTATWRCGACQRVVSEV